MENNSSSRNYNIQLGRRNINNKSKNNNNNSNNNKQKPLSQQSKTIFVPHFHQSVTVDDLNDMFDLKSTKYFRNNCQIEMHHFSNAGQPFASATVTVSAHVCEELLKLHSIDSHDNPLIVEMSKSPLEQSNHYFQLPLQSHQSTGLYIAMKMQ